MDDSLVFGLGALPSPEDPRDWSVADLYAALAVAPAPLPAAYRAPNPFPPVLNQGVTPMCVAYSAAAMKRWDDIRDQSDFDSDEPLFFAQIGGTAQGAVTRNALDRLLGYGYPVTGNAAAASVHKIAAYFAVPVTRDDICAAILQLGPVLLAVNWGNSWFRPVNGILPAWDSAAGGHAILAVGWTADGLVLRNSWGQAWGSQGEAVMRWADLPHVRECWRAQDQIVAPPAARYAVRIAHGAVVRIASVTASRPPRITGWTDRPWTGAASSAPCAAPEILKGVRSGQATVVRVTKGAFAGRRIHIGSGVALARTA